MANKPHRIAGLDLSLTSTGAALICDGQVYLTRIQPSDRLSDDDRIDRIRSAVWRVVEGADLIVMEQLAYASTTGKATERAGLWWICRRMIWRAGLPIAVVVPSQLKKYATGYGSGPNSGKDKVLAATVRRYPTVAVDGNDVADALVLAAMGADHLGHPLAPMPAAHRTVLARITWPDQERQPAP